MLPLLLIKFIHSLMLLLLMLMLLLLISPRLMWIILWCCHWCMWFNWCWLFSCFHHYWYFSGFNWCNFCCYFHYFRLFWYFASIVAVSASTAVSEVAMYYAFAIYYFHCLLCCSVVDVSNFNGVADVAPDVALNYGWCCWWFRI